jgi:hypothetical protein
MTKAEKVALEKIWLAEVENRLPFQSKAEIYRRLEREGLVRFDGETIYGKGRSPIDRIPIRVEGWYLTHPGRLLYCASC